MIYKSEQLKQKISQPISLRIKQRNDKTFHRCCQLSALIKMDNQDWFRHQTRAPLSWLPPSHRRKYQLIFRLYSSCLPKTKNWKAFVSNAVAASGGWTQQPVNGGQWKRLNDRVNLLKPLPSKPNKFSYWLAVVWVSRMKNWNVCHGADLQTKACIRIS